MPVSAPLGFANSLFATAQPQMQYSWRVSLDPPGLGIPSGFMFIAEQCSFPADTSEVLEYLRGNWTFTMPGRKAAMNFELTVIQYVDSNQLIDIARWRDKCSRPPFDNYKVDGSLEWLKPDGAMNSFWLLEGVWPSSAKSSPGDMTGTSFSRVVITFQVDKLIYQ